jgi:hypothetical protein
MRFLLFAIFLFTGLNLFAQTNKTLETHLISSPIIIDGMLNEAEWEKANTATDFIQSSPVLNEKAGQRTIVKTLYDNEALYVSAVLFDVNRDSITTTLSNRDDFGNADYFGVMIDTYGSSTIAFAFMVTSAGVQIDDLFSGDDVDRNWNAVWESKVIVENNKWTVEIKIPFSAVRFPNQEVQNWEINFNRSTRRNREDSFWNAYDPTKSRFISQFGDLKGLKGIESPLRLSFSPYLSTYTENYEGNTNTRFNGGMDLKLGLNDAFTIDMTLIPDFNQVQSDNQVLNLSPFEIKFNENRQFFTEGTELFNKGGIFHSRRIGGSPIHQYSTNEKDNEQILSNPSATPLLNATKLSGRTKNGLGIGVFNGITRQVVALIQDTITNTTREFITSPLTNYNVLVFDQNLKNNSTVTLTNTSVWRSGNTYDANVTAMGFDLFNSKRTYNLFGNMNVSQLYDIQNEFGYASELNFEKSSGQFQYGMYVELADEKYNPNDLGYLNRNNYQIYNLNFQYYTYKSFWNIYKSWSNIEFEYGQLFNPNVYTSTSVFAEYGATFKNFLTAGIQTSYDLKSNDYFESRIDGRHFTIPSVFNYGGFYSSNYAKRFALDIRLENELYETDRKSYYLRISPRIRISDKLTTIYAISAYQSQNEQGLALTNDFTSIIIDSNPIFGKRNRQNIENSIEANYIFTNRMGLSFKLRHYWAKVSYDSFYELQNNGSLLVSSYTGLSNDGLSNHNNNFNAFTIDMVYKWVFAPGSEFSLVWKNALFSSTNEIDHTYFENTKKLTELPANNSISLKLLYYIDYYKIKSKF